MILSGLCAYFCEVKPLTTYNHRISFPCGQQNPLSPFHVLLSRQLPLRFLLCSVLFICFVLVSTFSVTAAFYADYNSPLPLRSLFYKYAPSGNCPAQVREGGGRRSFRKAGAKVLPYMSTTWCDNQLETLPAHVACSMGHNGVCAVSLSSSYLLFPPASGWLSSVVVIPPDWWLPKRFLTRTCRVCCLALPSPPSLPYSFAAPCLSLSLFPTLTLSAATRRISVKSPKISWLLHLQRLWRVLESATGSTIAEVPHVIAICKCLKLFVVPRAVASVHNSVNYFRQFDSSLSSNTRRNIIQVNMENKRSSPDVVTLSRRNSSQWKGFSWHWKYA